MGSSGKLVGNKSTVSQVALVEKFYVVSPAVANGAGDHRAARTPPWRGALVDLT